MMSLLGGFVLSLWGILLDAASWLLVGFALAGVIKVVVDRGGWLDRALGARGPRSVVLAALLGAPMPLCSCSVLPVALGLRRQGASRGATASFLVSVPETDIVSVALTWALLGPAMAIVRPLAAVITAIGTGIALDLAPGRDRREADSDERAACCGLPGEGPRPAWWRRAIRYGFVEFFDDVAGPLILGLLLAAAVSAVAERHDLFAFVGHPVGGYVTALLVGIPTYVCATASTPIAVGLLAAGMSPGAVLVFLLVGPATNVASFVVLQREFGRSGLVLHLGGIALGSLIFGLFFDRVLRQDVRWVEDLRATTHAPASGVQVVAVVLLVTLLLMSAWRSRRLRRLVRRS